MGADKFFSRETSGKCYSCWLVGGGVNRGCVGGRGVGLVLGWGWGLLYCYYKMYEGESTVTSAGQKQERSRKTVSPVVPKHRPTGLTAKALGKNKNKNSVSIATTHPTALE